MAQTNFISDVTRDHLRHWVSDIQSPDPQKPILMLTGVPGSGKTLLSYAVASAIASDPDQLFGLTVLDVEALLTVAASGRPIILDNIARYPKSINNMLLALAYGQNFTVETKKGKQDVGFPERKIIIMNCMNTGQFHADFLHNCTVINLQPLSRSDNERATPDDIKNEVSSFLSDVIKRRERKPADSINDEDLRAIGIIMKALHFHLDTRDDIFRIISIVQDNADFFGHGPGKGGGESCIKIAADFLEEQVKNHALNAAPGHPETPA